MKVAIVGAGIVGLSVAHSLVEAGCEVVLLDAGDIPNPHSASYDLSRMMRLQYGPQGGYARLAKRALTSWAKLETSLGTRLYHPTGVCVWPATAAAWTEATRSTLGQAGAVLRNADSDGENGSLLRRQVLGPGICTEEGGVLLAKATVTALAAAVALKGAVLRSRTRVLGIDAARGVVRTSAGETIQADSVIAAAGAWTPKLLPHLAKSLSPIRSIVVYATPPAEIAEDWAVAPCTVIETRESMLYALPPVPGAPLKLAGTANLRPADPDRPEPVSPDEARAVLEAFRPYLSNIDRYEIAGTAMGHYADPPDKTFIVERQDRATIVSGCGGRMFKFGPLLGEELAAVVTGAAAASLLDHWCHSDQ